MIIDQSLGGKGPSVGKIYADSSSLIWLILTSKMIFKNNLVAFWLHQGYFTEGSLFPVFSWGTSIQWPIAVSFEAEEYWFGKVLFCILRSVLIIQNVPKKDGLAFWRHLEDNTCQGSSIQWPIKYWFDL